MSEEGEIGFAGAPCTVVGEDPYQQHQSFPAVSRATSTAAWAKYGADIDTSVRMMVATVMFVDIRRFGDISDSLSPAATLRLLDQYLQCVQGAIEVHGGRVDVLVGDGLLAVFEGRGPDSDHAGGAVRAAQAILAELAIWNRHRTTVGEAQIDVGIGINTAVIACGHFRSLHTQMPRIAGTGVNVAARLQSVCGLYGTRVLIGEETRRRVKREFPLRLIDHIILKGRHAPDRIYEAVVDPAGFSWADIRSLLKDYHNGLRHCRRERYHQAAEAFQRVLARRPADGPARLHLERCRSRQSSVFTCAAVACETCRRAHTRDVAIVQCSKTCCVWSDSRYHLEGRSDG